MVNWQQLEETAKELRRRVRERAGLQGDWERAGSGMRKFYFELAKRVEGRKPWTLEQMEKP